MSTDPAATPPADPNTTSKPVAAEKPSRNPIERIIVWGLILVLVLVCGREAIARFGYTNSLNNLQAALAGDADGEVLTLAEAEQILSGFPSREAHPGENRISYHWSGFKDYGTIHLTYTQDKEIVGLVTADAEPEPPPEEFPEDESDAQTQSYADESAPEGNSGGGTGRPGRGGRERGFDPLQFDEDGDGKVSRDEAPERMQQNFDRIDENGDGFADEAELATMRERFSQRGGRGDGGNDDGRPQRPQRPMEDDADSTTTQTSEESAESAAERPAVETKPAEDTSADAESADDPTTTAEEATPEQ